MAIATVTAFGIQITDEFGGYLREYKDLYNAIKEEAYKKEFKVESIKGTDAEEDFEDYYSYFDLPYCATCPSAEDNQVVLGFYAENTGKRTDWKALEEKWHNLIKDTPKHIQDLIKGLIPNPDPDLVEMSGKY
jgi:hypothetical protein